MGPFCCDVHHDAFSVETESARGALRLQEVLARAEAPPVFFTDFCREAANMAHQVLQAVGAELTYPICINPFRRPFSCAAADNALPSYSNGFLFGINTAKSPRPAMLMLGSRTGLRLG